MKLAFFIFFTLIVISTAYGQGDPAPFIKGQWTTGLGNSGSTIFVPNSQSTKINAYQALIETGNKNLLVNPSFESSTPIEGWVLTMGSGGTEVAYPIDGKNYAKLALSSQALEFFQDSTTNVNALADGVQGLAYLRVKTTVSGLKVCPRREGVTSYPCVDVNNNGKWGLYKVPFVLGGVSNGVVITSNGVSVTGDVYIDDAFVGAQDLKQELNIVGPWKSYTPTLVGFGTVSNLVARYRQVGQDLEISVRFNVGTVSSSTATMTLPTGHTVSSALTGYTVIGKGNSNATSATNFSGSSVLGLANASVLYFGSENSTQDGSVARPGNGIASSSGTYSFFASVPTNELQGATSVYSTESADTDWQACTFSTLAWQGLGTVTNTSLQCKRQGSDLLMKGYWNTGTTSGSVAQFLIPTWNGVQLTTKTNLTSVGRMVRDNATANTVKDYVLFTLGGTSYLNISYPEYVGNVSPVAGVAGTSANGNFSLENVRIPIQGWENSNVIIGSFKEVVTTPGVSKPITISGRIATTGALSSQLGDAITSCTNANPMVCTFNSNVFSPDYTVNCTVESMAANATFCKATGASNASFSLQCFNDAGSNFTTTVAKSVFCHGVAK